MFSETYNSPKKFNFIDVSFTVNIDSLDVFYTSSGFETGQLFVIDIELGGKHG